jgi:Leucine-rich repeat (LRR) protein
MRRMMLLALSTLALALALINHAAATREPSSAYQEAKHQRNLLQTTNRAGTATEQVIGRLDFGLERQEALPSPGGEQALKNHGSEPNGPASKPSAIPGLHEAIADLSIGIGSSGSYSPGHGARWATTIPQMEEGLRSEGPDSESRDDIDSAGTASMERRQGEIVPTPCSPLRCSFNVNSAGTLSRAEGIGCADPECQALDLNDRGIKAIATDAFSGMVNLEVLTMNNNQLGYISNSHLQDLVALEDLYMSYNHLTSISNGTFRGLSSLKSLHLMYNAIGSITAETFTGLSGLKRLAMGHQRSNPKALSTGILSSIEDGSFRHMPLLEDLDLEYHVLSKISNDMLGGGLSNLKFLNLRGSRFLADFTTDFLLVEPHAFTGLASLETLDFSFAGVNSEALKPGLFRCCTRLKSLDLSANPIEALTANAFAGLGNSLETLNLIFCMISRLSSRTFKGLTKLEILNLGNNRLSVVPSEVFATLPEGCFVYFAGNSMSCRPKTAKDAEPDSNTTYPVNMYQLDLSLSLCPVQVILNLHPIASWNCYQ